MTTYYLMTFTVFGHMQFPFDMLRYDSCWPRSQDDVCAMRTCSRCESVFESQPVTLNSIVSNKHAQPTADRWRSFGYTVSDVRVVKL